jgi:integrase
MGKKLTDKAIRAAKPWEKAYKLYDADGLFLLVNPNGSKYWRFKYRFQGKEKSLSLGVYDPTKSDSVGLADARAALAAARDILKGQKDPSRERKRANREKLLSAENTFQAVAKDWWEQQKPRWTENHANRVWESLKSEAFPHIGDLPITDIEAPDVLAVVRRVESRGALDVASRVLQRCSAVFRFAVQSGRAKYNPAIDLKGVLKTRKVQHQASVSREDLPELLRGVEGYEGDPVTRYALKLLTLTFVRPGELRGARWEEFDLEAKQWRIPAERMKMSSEHVVPLSRQAVELLKELAPFTERHELLFPGNRTVTRPISENTMTYALYRIGFKSRATPHGMRATASSILNEEGFNRDAIERQLSHIERNKVRGAYTHHAEYLNERMRIMQWWADYLDRVRTESNVIPAMFGRKR